MDNHTKERLEKAYKKKQLQKIARLHDVNQDLKNLFNLVSSELDLLKSRIQHLNHDLRNPLYGIIGMLDLMVNEDDDEDQIEVQTGDLIIIRQSAQSLLGIINGTLSIPESEKSLKEQLNIDRKLTSVIKVVSRIYLPMAQNKGISLSLNTHVDSEIQLSPNFYNNLIQITGNLVANAIKFTKSNGSVDVEFSLNTMENDRVLNLTVADTGKSMSLEQVSAFNQGKPVTRSTGTNGEQGFGMGLLHVIQMVSDNGGHIFVKSGKNPGTIFIASLPLQDNYTPRENGIHSTVNNGI